MVNLSIIIPHYNSVFTLNKLLQTIPNRKDIQVIVVDDNSENKYKNELLKLKNEYIQSNVEFYNNNTNTKGAGSCRNIGLKLAKGKWLIFADADDYFLNSFFDIVKKYFTSEYDVVFFKPTSIEIDSGKLSQRHKHYEMLIDNFLKYKSISNEMFLRYYFHVPWSKLINSSLLKKNKIIFDEVIASNDVMFSTKVGHSMKNFKVTEEVIYCVTRNRGSLTTTISHEIFDSRLNVYINYYHFLKKNLSKEMFQLLNVSGRYYLLQSLNLGFKKTFMVFIKLKRNNVHIINFKVLNPIRITKVILGYYQKRKKMNRYFKKTN